MLCGFEHKRVRIKRVPGPPWWFNFFWGETHGSPKKHLFFRLSLQWASRILARSWYTIMLWQHQTSFVLCSSHCSNLILHTHTRICVYIHTLHVKNLEFSTPIPSLIWIVTFLENQTSKVQRYLYKGSTFRTITISLVGIFWSSFLCMAYIFEWICLHVTWGRRKVRNAWVISILKFRERRGTWIVP